MEYWRTLPDEFRGLMALQVRLKTGFDPKLFELVSLRVAQISECPFCVDLHGTEARKAGETERRIGALVVWRDTPFFSPPERAALEWAERLTRLGESRSLDEPYAALQAHFSDRQIAQLTFSIAVMNAMTRIAIGFGRTPVADEAAETPSASPAPA